MAVGMFLAGIVLILAATIVVAAGVIAWIALRGRG